MQIRSLRDLKEVLIISILTIFVLFVGERLGLWEPGGDLDNLIYEAAESGDIEAVKQHLADETDISLKCTGCGGTALGHAAKHGHNEIAELLIENGADVNVENNYGYIAMDMINSAYDPFTVNDIKDTLRNYNSREGTIPHVSDWVNEYDYEYFD